MRDIIAIGGTKTYQLNNLEMLFQDEEKASLAQNGKTAIGGSNSGSSPTGGNVSLKQLIEF